MIVCIGVMVLHAICGATLYGENLDVLVIEVVVV